MKFQYNYYKLNKIICKNLILNEFLYNNYIENIDQY